MRPPAASLPPSAVQDLGDEETPAGTALGVPARWPAEDEEPGTESGPHRLPMREGTPIGPWILHRRLQRGGCAEVFHAFHESTGVEAAVKVVRPDAPNGKRLEDALRYEAELLGRIEHPHVVRLYEQGELDDGRPYLAMELARGHDLADRLDQHGTQPIPLVVEVGRQLLAALGALAAAGVVHRDVKPENVMLEETDDGLRVKLVDLGIAVSTRDPWTERARGSIGAFAGTPQYVAPEQAQALPVDQRADLYSLGAVLYELLAGVPPCVGATTYDTLVKVITHEPSPIRLRRPDCPPALEGAVLQALAKRPEDRFQSAASMARALGICAKMGGMPEGAKAFEGAPRVPSNATRPFELHREKPAAATPVQEPSIAAVLAARTDRTAPLVLSRPIPGDALPEARPDRTEPRREPPRDRSAIFVENEDTARWLWPLTVAMLVIALAGAVLGSGEVDLPAPPSRPAPPPSAPF